MLDLLADPVLVAEIIDAVEEGWLLLLLGLLIGILLLGCLGVRAVKIKCFSLLVADGIGARVVKGVIVSG